VTGSIIRDYKFSPLISVRGSASVFEGQRFGSASMVGVTQSIIPTTTQRLFKVTSQASIFPSIIGAGAGAGIGAGFAFALPTLKGFDGGISDKAFMGGERKSAYIPSFSALVGLRTGRGTSGRLSKSGLDYRPVSSKFKLSSGRSFLRL
jgi:hypothetical protein